MLLCSFIHKGLDLLFFSFRDAFLNFSCHLCLSVTSHTFFFLQVFLQYKSIASTAEHLNDQWKDLLMRHVFVRSVHRTALNSLCLEEEPLNKLIRNYTFRVRKCASIHVTCGGPRTHRFVSKFGALEATDTPQFLCVNNIPPSR